jgi:hypothetical protein
MGGPASSREKATSNSTCGKEFGEAASKRAALWEKRIERTSYERANLRRWHGHIGIGLALFLVLQAGTGLLFTIRDLQWPHGHASESSPGRQHAQAWGLPSGHGETESGREKSESAFQAGAIWGPLMTIHHGGGVIGTVYRLVLAAAIIVQIVLGVLIFGKMRARPQKTRPKKRRS